MLERKAHNKIPITIEKESFRCPIAREIFLDPVMVYPCEHIFENDCIMGWCKDHTRCPLCRATINTILPTSSSFNDLFDQFLQNNPSLHDERYFNLQSFARCLSDQEKHARTLKKMIALLKSSEMRMNAISDEKYHEGITAVTYLCGTQKGQELLLIDPELRGKIRPEELNAIIQEGQYSGCSAVTFLAGTRELLLIDPSLRGKIRSEGLNAIGQNGDSAVYWLAISDKGINLLLIDPELRGKIRPEGLNAIGQCEEYRGLSAVYWLTKKETGRKLLLADARLRSLITKEALNTIVQAEGPEKGKSPAYWLQNTPEGQELLKIDPTLKEKIDCKAIFLQELQNAVRETSWNTIGAGLFFCRTKMPHGMATLKTLLRDWNPASSDTAKCFELVQQELEDACHRETGYLWTRHPSVQQFYETYYQKAQVLGREIATSKIREP